MYIQSLFNILKMILCQLLATLMKTIYFQIDQTSSAGNAVLSTPNIESSVSSLPSTSSKAQSIDSQLNFDL